MKKIFIIIVFSFILFYPTISLGTDNTKEIIETQKDSVDINKFINESQKYTSDVFKDTDLEELFNDVISGNIDNQKIVKSVIDLIGRESLSSIKTIAGIMIVIIIHGILKSISDNLKNSSISQVSYYVQYILIVTLIMKNFAEIITMVKDSITNLVVYSNTLIPILITLVITTGNIVSANILQPVLLFLITFISNFIFNVIIPVILASTILSIVSKISDRIQLDKLSKFLKSGSVWILGVILTLFVSMISVEGSLSSSVDGITAKTAKAAVSSFIPVVGKILSDAVDSVIGCASILKNAVGIIGVIVIIAICITPIIKLVLLMASYYIGAALCQPIADNKIIALLEQMGDTFKILLAILCSLSVMLIIGTTLVMKISNGSLMYS